MISESILSKEIKKVQETLVEEDGCYFIRLTGEEDSVEKDLYLVFCANNKNDLSCKIAYNTDDLQEDYNFDWFGLTNKEGTLISLDIKDCRKFDFIDLASCVVNEIKYYIENSNKLLFY